MDSGISSRATYANLFFFSSKLWDEHKDSGVRGIFKRANIALEIHKLIVFSFIIQAEGLSFISFDQKRKA